MTEVYRSRSYTTAPVTGRYVFYCGKRRGFRVYETTDGTGRFAGQPGKGPTVREYLTPEIPEPYATRARELRRTIEWPLDATVTKT